MFDFSHEEDQKDYVNRGPVPSGSVVPVRLFLLEVPEDSRDPHDRHIKLTRNGLRQLYVRIEVDWGTYKDCNWRQTFTLPKAMQNIGLTEKQETACRIGGSMLKAILEANNMSLQVRDLLVFNGLRFFAKVKINDYQRTSINGNAYWLNEISQVIGPDHKDYALLKKQGEMINENGAVTGNSKSQPASSNFSRSANNSESFAPSESFTDYTDEVPF